MSEFRVGMVVRVIDEPSLVGEIVEYPVLVAQIPMPGWARVRFPNRLHMDLLVFDEEIEPIA